MNVATALQLLAQGLNAYNILAASIGKTMSEGRSELTDDEVALFRQADNEHRATLQAEIDKQLSETSDSPSTSLSPSEI